MTERIKLIIGLVGLFAIPVVGLATCFIGLAVFS